MFNKIRLDKIKPLIYLALGSLLLSFVSFFFWIYANKSKDNIYFGTIQNITDNRFMITDEFNGKVNVEISTTTKILKGKNSIFFSDLHSGDFTQVIGSTDEKGAIQAEVVRLMNLKNKER